ncbi:IucA/IucC family protein [Aquimarina hainanensis]|uniref:IucA/IucC family protein n=1 Tax=Aquimarina hainanensis TaxID=1578017 RepID=A0ABW5N7X6_9FLAO|nr:IucA/IucC family siderophore biosynthesis protein [Aquimarina sp. TRL1]QKX03685.1 IucA/IucC family siderophore biosynthesis protein [Aquimarina sp. TRL1]
MNRISPKQASVHLTPKHWYKSNRHLIKKAICEFYHELLIKPTIVSSSKNGWNTYELAVKNSTIKYTFDAKLLHLRHLWIKDDSLRKTDNNRPSELDVVSFFKEFKSDLGIDDARFPVYLEEVISTLHGSIYKLSSDNLTSDELVHADFQTIEKSMTEGHPGFVANNGRIGFDSTDYQAYAPETGKTFSLIWLAGHKDHTHYSAKKELPYKILIEQELGKDTITRFNQIITEKGQHPESYYFIPVHPWQWHNKLVNIFSPQIAKGDLIFLGSNPDQYQPQQSIRTLFNISNPHKFYTKTALSILNMGFVRGLAMYYLESAPKVAAWLEELLYKDPYIIETNFRMLSEIGAVSFINPYFEALGPESEYNRLLASLWRESPTNMIKREQKLMTMAAFLHIDTNGEAFLPKLINASGLSIDDWLRSYLKAYLSPFIHCFYKYDLVFMPHGENLIMVMDNNVPVGSFLKDITDEATILSPDIDVPEEIKRIYEVVPDDIKILSFFIDIFDGFFRYMAHILEEHAAYDQNNFWRIVAENIQQYQERHPELNDKFDHYDLFAGEFQLSCLNRLQLNQNRQMIDMHDAVSQLQFVGKLQNPIAIFKKENTFTN